ncbi:MAG: protein-glutamate methylesterase/protein-glutamine glutaminase [Methylocystis sp.]|jgi:two-component system chemotaxis response regulator CheB
MTCRVLIVDDSRSMRALIAETLRRDPRIEVVGEAADPLAARDAIKELDPDVITLDIEMPKMNGLEFLDRLMKLRPTRVIIVSSLTERGAATTIHALEMGAMECVAKPSIKDRNSFDDLAQKVVQVATAPKPKGPPARVVPADGVNDDRSYAPDGRIVAIGASMGGVDALFTVLSALPANCPPTVVVQHMPALFTRSFAARLDRACKASVAEAKDNEPLEVGRVLIAPGGATHLQLAKRGRLICRLVEGDLMSGHRPSIDVLFRSVAKVSGPNALGVILTGMGRDGAEGLLELRNAGANTIGQDEATSIVYGMPRAAYEIDAVEIQLPLHKIGARIVAATNATKARVSCP